MVKRRKNKKIKQSVKKRKGLRSLTEKLKLLQKNMKKKVQSRWNIQVILETNKND
jgi:hypothetical protein